MSKFFPKHKTKIVCTVGPASWQPATLKRMVSAGMNIARLNLAHGSPDDHVRMIRDIRAAAKSLNRRVAILADLPGPKMRVGQIPNAPIHLRRDQKICLTDDPKNKTEINIPLDCEGLRNSIRTGATIYLNDGFIQLKVTRIDGHDIHCRVIVGGSLYSHNGLNIPGIDLGIAAFTEEDRKLMSFALDAGVDALSVSFVQRAADIHAARAAAAERGFSPFIIGKIERGLAVENIDEILSAADGIMVARGDLGVETPIEAIAVTQKALIRKANLRGRPVITATQMLESMTENRRPTRAEATDVANAILDGTDCVMLSGESAMGSYPVDAVRMMARIASTVEPSRSRDDVHAKLLKSNAQGKARVEDVMAMDMSTAVDRLKPRIVVAPTDSGATARRLSRFKFPHWIVAFTSSHQVCQNLCFSYGVYPEMIEPGDYSWRELSRQWCADHDISSGRVVMTHGPSRAQPDASSFVEIFEL
ncbi:MAG: pyruvate kinase [Pseudomonadota bacterium]|nr:pyruvate kinase [Pseudomonadota bacterium]